MDRKQPAETKPEPFFPRYPAVEQLVDSEDFDRVNREFGRAYDELEAIAKQKGGLGKASDAKKGMRALERVMDLLKYLLKLKYEYLEAQGGGNQSEGKTPQQKKSGEKQLQRTPLR